MGGDANLYRVLYGAGAPEATAIVDPDGTIVTYAELDAGAQRLSSALTAAGVAAGDRVSTALDKGVAALLVVHAALRIGAIVQPLNPQSTERELATFLQDAEPVLIVAGPSYVDAMQPLADSCGARLETLADPMDGSLPRMATGDPPPITPREPGDDAVLLYTSGTTGAPKGARITHGNLGASARALVEVWGMTADDRLLHALPLTHAHGLLTATNTMLAAGAQIELLRQFDTAAVVEALPRASVFMGVPTFYARLVEDPGFGSSCRHLRLLISGSAPLGARLHQAVADAADLQARERYGATETAIVAAVPADADPRPGWVGWPLPGVEVRLRPNEGATEPDDANVGALETRGHNVFAGYWRRPDADREAFTADGWFRTGDIAEIDASGCIRIVGRTKDLVITGGVNVHPGEVEAVLEELPEIAAAAVFGVPHADLGEAVVAAVEAAAPVDADAVRARVRRELAGYKVPKRLLTVDAIPRDRMGKIRKALLRESYAGLFEQPDADA
jgi:malonyl-CoA/methylmalonyl-CoA synthetase